MLSQKKLNILLAFIGLLEQDTCNEQHKKRIKVTTMLGPCCPLERELQQLSIVSCQNMC